METIKWKAYDTVREHKVVDKIPVEYLVWNIGQIPGYPEYCPLCICYPDSYYVQADKLLAIRMTVDEVRAVMMACGLLGAGNLKEAKELKRLGTYENGKKLSSKDRKILNEAIPVFEKYTAKED